MSDADRSKPWLTASELAQACGSTVETVEALARANHWPRVSGPDGSKYAVDVSVVRQALAGSPNTVHGSIPL